VNHTKSRQVACKDHVGSVPSHRFTLFSPESVEFYPKLLGCSWRSGYDGGGVLEMARVVNGESKGGKGEMKRPDQRCL